MLNAVSNNRRIQQEDQSGKTKLTAVTIGHGTNKRQFFVMLEHDKRGVARLPVSTLFKVLDAIRQDNKQAVA